LSFKNVYFYYLHILKNIFVFIKLVICIYIILINRINNSNFQCKNNKSTCINYSLTGGYGLTFSHLRKSSTYIFMIPMSSLNALSKSNGVFKLNLIYYMHNISQLIQVWVCSFKLIKSRIQIFEITHGLK